MGHTSMLELADEEAPEREDMTSDGVGDCIGCDATCPLPSRLRNPRTEIMTLQSERAVEALSQALDTVLPTKCSTPALDTDKASDRTTDDTFWAKNGESLVTTKTSWSRKFVEVGGPPTSV